MIFSLNEKFLSNVKNKLTIESHLYLSNEKKIILNHIPLVHNEKNISVSLLTLNNLPLLVTFILTSVSLDLVRKNMRLNFLRISRNASLRLLIINSFYYMFLVDNEKFYSIIYYKQRCKISKED